MRRPKSNVRPTILVVGDNWSGARVGCRQLAAMVVALVVMSVAAFARGEPFLALVGLVGPVVVAVDHLAGSHRSRGARG